MGFDFTGGGGGIPEYSDVSAKINLPLKRGNFSWVTLLGASQIFTKSNFDDPDQEWKDGDKGQNMKMTNAQMFTGINYTHRFNASTRLENRLSYQLFRQKASVDEIDYTTRAKTPNQSVLNNQESRMAWQSILNHRMNAKSLMKGGIGADFYQAEINDIWDGRTLSDFSGNSALVKAFAQFQYRFSNAFSMTPGLYGQLYTLNSDYSIEPRMGFKWDASPRSSFSLGSGLHSQLQPRQVYFYKENDVLPNKNLKMSKSWQTVLGYQQKLGAGMHLKTEAYYQSLFDIPVTTDPKEESILNMGDDFSNAWDFVFVNDGTGRNYGVEMTLEKFFDKQYYFLLTASLFDSKYTAFDKKERRTRFAGNYAFNALFGYEWKLGANRLLSVNTKTAYVGGKRYVPVTVSGSATSVNDFVFHYDRAYTEKLSDYFRMDLNVNMKVNYKRWSVEWFVEVNNITNHQNVWYKYINDRGKEEYIYQYGLMPIGGCRVYF